MKKIVILIIIIVSSCATPATKETSQKEFQITFTQQKSPTKASLRGLSVVDENIIWASGQYGTVLKTTNGGETWEAKKIPDTDSIDFRDIHGFDENNAFLLSAGSPALIYKTTDGGDSWKLQYKNPDPAIFLDGFDFSSPEHGMVMGDPMDSHFVLLLTNDGGRQWKEIPAKSIPHPAKGEAGFAASGTGVVMRGDNNIWFATGGLQARVFRSDDNGTSWQVSETPMMSGEASTGIFSLAFIDDQRAVAVGGDYVAPEANHQNAIYSEDGGISWSLATTPPNGYRSGLAYNPAEKVLVTVGTTGSDYSSDGGINWLPIDTASYHAIQFTADKNFGWATGGNGKIAKIVITDTKTNN